MKLLHLINRRIVEILSAAFLLLFVFFISRYAGLAVSGHSVHIGRDKPVVVLDCGHGGNDPGKVGVDKSLEKDINLAVALKLKRYLEQSDVKVVMTRDSDMGLYREGDRNKKTADMKNRCQKIAGANPDIVVSIHQNSYHQEEVSGAQVFYYKGSEKGKKLAQIIQKRFDYCLGEKNTRIAKANDNYYLLLHVKCPIVIVENQ